MTGLKSDKIIAENTACEIEQLTGGIDRESCGFTSLDVCCVPPGPSAQVAEESPRLSAL